MLIHNGYHVNFWSNRLSFSGLNVGFDKWAFSKKGFFITYTLKTLLDNSANSHLCWRLIHSIAHSFISPNIYKKEQSENIMRRILLFLCVFQAGQSLFSLDPVKPDEILVTCLEDGNPETVLQALNNGANPNIEWRSAPALVTAVKVKRPDLVRTLLQKANLIHDDNKSIALYSAMVQNDPKLCKALLKAGADPKDILVSHDHENVRLVLERDPKIISMFAQFGRETEYREAWQCVLEEVIKVENTEKVKLLLDSNVNPDGVGESMPPMLLAIRGGNLEIVKLLIKAGVNINVDTPGWGTPLNEAVERNEPKILKQLIDNNVKLVDLPSLIRSALGKKTFFDVELSSIEVARLLLPHCQERHSFSDLVGRSKEIMALFDEFEIPYPQPEEDGVQGIFILDGDEDEPKCEKKPVLVETPAPKAPAPRKVVQPLAREVAMPTTPVTLLSAENCRKLLEYYDVGPDSWSSDEE